MKYVYIICWFVRRGGKMGCRKENKIRSRIIFVCLFEFYWIFKIEGNKSSIIESVFELYKIFVFDVNCKVNSIINFEYR